MAKSYKGHYFDFFVMKEKTLLRIALGCSIVGIFIIFIFADKLEPEITDISEITSSSVGQTVKIGGEISSIRKTSSVVILDVKDETGSINIVIFDDGYFELKKDDSVGIIGKVAEYKGKLQIESEKITLSY